MEQEHTIEDYGQPEHKQSLKLLDQVLESHYMRESYNPSERQECEASQSSQTCNDEEGKVQTQVYEEPRKFEIVEDNPIIENGGDIVEEEDSYAYYDEEEEESKEIPEIMLSSLRRKRETISEEDR